MPRISLLWRHPIKSHGKEALDRVMLRAGKTMPGDRVWAVAHDAAMADGTEWAPCANFSRGAKAPQLMSIDAKLDDATGQVTLTHHSAGTITFDPDGDIAGFLAWVRPIMPADRAQSARILRAPDRGMTDSPFPSISLISRASLDALSQEVGQVLEPERFRANIWLDDMAPFEEFDWIGQDLTIGAARLHVEERITRCLATTVNTTTGMRDADTLDALSRRWDHTDLGVYATVIEDGEIALGDTVVMS